MTTASVLKDVRVIDFSRYIAGPYCAAMLGWLGADVIRVERPGGGEDRYVGPINDVTSALFMKTGGNKRSLTLDMKASQAGHIIERLIKSADVVIANMPPRILKRLGLDYESLCAIKPDIILTTQTCFGHLGPWADRGGFDGIGQVMSGAAYMSGTAGEPRRSAAPYVDYSTAVLGAFGTLAALYEKRSSGRGQHVQASLLGSALGVFAAPLIEQAVAAPNRIPIGNRGQTAAPTDIFKARDGMVLMQVVGNGLFARLAKLINHPEWLDHADYASDELRGDHRDELCAVMAQWMAGKTVDEALEILSEGGVPCGPVLDLDGALNHPQVAAMNYLRQTPIPGTDEVAPVPRLPLDFSAFEVQASAPPAVGEHTDTVLSEIGFDADAIKQLRQTGVV